MDLDSVLAQVRLMADVETEANECLVPETKNEMYDCCGSDVAIYECEVFGFINAIMLVSIVTSIFVLHYKSTWFHNNWLLTFTLCFQVLPALWRTLFLLHAGYKGASPGQYIVFRSSDAGDFVVSLTGFAMYMY